MATIPSAVSGPSPVTVPSLLGDVPVDELGVVLMHEHVFIRSESLQWNWPGYGGWDEETEVRHARERLTEMRATGIDTILDMTVPGLMRDPALVAKVVAGIGLNVLFATGYYTFTELPLAFQYRGPGKPFDGHDGRLESLFERDITVGIGDTGVKAAVLKLATDKPGLTPDVERLGIAVAHVHARTGTVICTHANAQVESGLIQQKLLGEHGVDLGRVMIGHSNETTDLSYVERLIDAGSYVGWDRCGLQRTVPLEGQMDCLAELCRRGYADRLMLGHDKVSFVDWAARHEMIEPSWEYTYIQTGMLPGLRQRGVTEEQIEQMLVTNPMEFFAGRGTGAGVGADARKAAPRSVQGS